MSIFVVGMMTKGRAGQRRMDCISGEELCITSFTIVIGIIRPILTNHRRQWDRVVGTPESRANHSPLSDLGEGLPE